MAIYEVTKNGLRFTKMIGHTYMEFRLCFDLDEQI